MYQKVFFSKIVENEGNRFKERDIEKSKLKQSLTFVLVAHDV